jgi:glycosyltransferase 2 family protein
MIAGLPLRWFALNLSLALLFMWLVARQLEWQEVTGAFRDADLSWIAAALVTFALGYSCRIARWRAMLERENPLVRWSNCAGPFLAAIAANNTLPFRAGDVLRSFAFNSTLGVGTGVAAATVLVERLLDLLLLLVVFGCALVWFDLDATRIAGAGGLVLLAMAAAILLALCKPQVLAPFTSIIGKLVCRFSPRFGRRFDDEANKGIATLRHLSGRGMLVRLMAWSAIAWLAEGCMFWCCALAFPSIAVPAAAWLALPVGTIATLIPSTPGYVGTFDYFTARAMTESGNALAAATAFAVAVHAVLWIPPTLVGGSYLLISRRGLNARLLVLRS